MNQLRIEVSVETQTLRLLQGRKTLREFAASTAARGIGFEPGSFRTPVGNFTVAEKIGAGAPSGTIFKAREPVGIWQPGQAPASDLVLTRILILEGLDPANRNTRERHVYVHGTNREDLVGQPASHGCVRLSNRDMIELFDLVPAGTPLVITPPRRSDMKLLFLDCDSTLSSIEGIDELAAAAGEKVHREVVDLTNAAMNGEIPLDEVFPRRMEIIKPDAATCREVANRYLATIQPGALKAVQDARAGGWTPVILSGGFAPLVAPLATCLGIHHVEAVPLSHDSAGQYLGYGKRFPTTRGGGKSEVIRRWIDATHPALVVMVGDGASDLETAEVVNAFIAYAGVVHRPAVAAGAFTTITRWNALARVLSKLEFNRRESPDKCLQQNTKRMARRRDNLLAQRQNSSTARPVMSAKKKTGVRYSAEKKAEVISFVNEYNKKKGRGGQAAAAAKFGITPLTVSFWMKKAKGPAAPAAAKVAKVAKAGATPAAAPAKRRGRKPGSGKAKKGAVKGTVKAAAAVPAGFSSKLRKLADLNDAIAATQAQLAKLKEQFKAAKKSL